MEHGVSAANYKDLVLFLATAGIVAPIFKRLKINPILGYLLAGVILGPFGLGRFIHAAPWLDYVTVDNPAEIAQLAEFGVVFLLFMIGLELSWERLRLMRRLVFGLGAAQVIGCSLVLAGGAILLGQPPAAALAIGAALTLSSTAIAVPVLAERRRLHSDAGRATFSVLLFQDLAVAPILITLAIVGRGHGEFQASDLLSLAPAALGLAVIVLVGRVALRPMLKSVAKAKSEEMFMAACLLVIIGAGLVSQMSGLSMALGAFVAGILLAETEYRHEVEVKIEPFKGLLLSLFFVSLGIRLDLSLLVAKPAVILGTVVGLLLVKAAVVFGIGLLMGLGRKAATEAALILAAGGEFAFVLLDNAMGAQVVSPAIGQAVLVSATLTMFLIPGLAALGQRLGRKGAPAPVSEAPAAAGPDRLGPEPTGQVLVIGYGRVGKLVGDMLGRHDLPWIAVDRDARLVERARRDGRRVYYGDAARVELLERCGLATARAVVVTMDAPEAAEAVVAAARGARPDLAIVARARDARHAARLYELGATDAVPETIEASLQLSEAVLVDIGVPMGLVIASIHERRDEYRKKLNRPDALGGKRRRLRDASLR
ncbi:cation:proton antiporter domain-containing protein [Caulobacter segnis]|uniref:Sodium/hydrogen exchanger n=1 Tax=Caulobacter segnis (strain ATCC 21756 / DSM 7131 / JCM 7823 / NBRC 15250 / LMG 17158 / TK0059) TaxID=509190 RepID=D5VPB0_CAUST|nr:cation:proton antiporter [Caulobacter segnis]ADG12333.1 sodium/hydrogen exchanger [Caulobacter segnis ATCC 21756]